MIIINRFISFGSLECSAWGSWYHAYLHYLSADLKGILVAAASRVNFVVLFYRLLARKPCVTRLIVDMHDGSSIVAGEMWVSFDHRKDRYGSSQFFKEVSGRLLVFFLQHLHYVNAYIMLHLSVHTIQSIEYFIQYFYLFYLIF